MEGNEVSEVSEVNVMFEKLVSNEKDFMGIVSYALYKQQKIEWIKEFSQKNGRGPSAEEMNTGFLAVAFLNSQQDVYRNSALELIEEFNWETLKSERKVMEEAIKNDAIVKAVTPSTKEKIVNHLVASLVSSVVTIGLAIAVWALAKGGVSGLIAEAEKNITTDYSEIVQKKD